MRKRGAVNFILAILKFAFALIFAHFVVCYTVLIFMMCMLSGRAVCGTDEWVDPEWPDALKKCLVKLWELYESKSTRTISDACDAAEKYYKLSQEKKELEEINKNMLEELDHIISDRQVRSISQKLLDIQKLPRLNAEK